MHTVVTMSFWHIWVTLLLPEKRKETTIFEEENAGCRRQNRTGVPGAIQLLWIIQWKQAFCHLVIALGLRCQSPVLHPALLRKTLTLGGPDGCRPLHNEQRPLRHVTPSAPGSPSVQKYIRKLFLLNALLESNTSGTGNMKYPRNCTMPPPPVPAEEWGQPAHSLWYLSQSANSVAILKVPPHWQENEHFNNKLYGISGCFPLSPVGSCPGQEMSVLASSSWTSYSHQGFSSSHLTQTTSRSPWEENPMKKYRSEDWSRSPKPTTARMPKRKLGSPQGFLLTGLVQTLLSAHGELGDINKMRNGRE